MERIGVSFLGGVPLADMVECVQLAEELGYESAWMAEGHGGDQFSILTSWALSTKTILLGTSISSVFVRSAPTIAMAAACVDHFSGGRCILGLGSSHKVQVEPDHGLDFSQPVQRLRECVDIVRILLRDGEVSYNGSVFDIKRFDFWFEPLRKEIPIYVAAVFPKMLAICGEISQGALLTTCTLEKARSAVEHVVIGAKRAGRDPKEVDVATSLRCILGPNKEEAAKSMRGFVAGYASRFPRYRRLMAEAGFPEEMEAVYQAWKGGNREQAIQLVPTALIQKFALVGTADDCRQRLNEYREAGLTLPLISPLVSDKDAKKRAMEIIRACAPQ